MGLGYTEGVTLVKQPGVQEPWDFLPDEKFETHDEFFRLRSIPTDQYLMKEVIKNIPGTGLSRDIRPRRLVLTSGFSYDPLTKTAHGYYMEVDHNDTTGGFYDPEETPSAVFALLLKTEGTSSVVEEVKNILKEWSTRDREKRPWATFEKGVQRPSQRFAGITVEVEKTTCDTYVVLIFRIAVVPEKNDWKSTTVQQAISSVLTDILRKARNYADEVVNKLKDTMKEKNPIEETRVCLLQITDFFVKTGDEYFFLNDTVACWPNSHGNIYLDLASDESPIKFVFGGGKKEFGVGLVSLLKEKENTGAVAPGNPANVAFHPVQNPCNYAFNPEITGEDMSIFEPLVHAVTMPLRPNVGKIEFIPASGSKYDQSRWRQAHHFSVPIMVPLFTVTAGARRVFCQPPAQIVPFDVHKRLEGTYFKGKPVIVSLKRQYGDEHYIVKKNDWTQLRPCLDAMEKNNISLDQLKFSNTSVKFPLSIFDDDAVQVNAATEL